MRAWIRAVPLTLSTTMFVAEAHAEVESWLSVRAPKHCEAASAGLADRVNRALVAARAPDRLASVVIEESDAGYEVTIRMTRGSVNLGTKVLGVPTCDEAADAAVVVLALALSEAVDVESAAPMEAPEPTEGSSNQRSAVRLPQASSNRPRSGAADQGVQRAAHLDERSTFRASFLTGVDAGTLPMPTVQVGAGITKTFDRVELRGTARYGLPYENEELDTESSERERHEFGALDLDACYALGMRFRLAGCAGGEVALVLGEYRARSPAGLTVESAAKPRLAGVLTALFAHRGGSVQPELELSSAVVLAGREDDAPFVALRAAAGVAMQF